jgi:Domain of unknown function (DUF4111)
VCAGSNPAEGAIQIAWLPDDAAELTEALYHGLVATLGDRLASLFLYGAVAFARPAGWRIDFDFHVLLNQPLHDSERAAIARLYVELGDASELGRELDGYYVLVRDAARAEPPRHQLDLEVRDEAWALHRAHVLAGRYFLVAGVDPRELVPQPTWGELQAALRWELQFVETHPDAPAFGILNGARILYSSETRDVVVSKYQAGQWALESLPDEWHDGLRAAMRFYARTPAADDTRIIEQRWAPFVEHVRRSIPLT